MTPPKPFSIEERSPFCNKSKSAIAFWLIAKGDRSLELWVRPFLWDGKGARSFWYGKKLCWNQL